MSPSDIGLSTGKLERQKHWRKLTEHYNFLKHADLDSNVVIYENQVDNLIILQHASAAFFSLFPGQHTVPLKCYMFLDTWRSSGVRHEWMAKLFEMAANRNENELRKILVEFCLADKMF